MGNWREELSEAVKTKAEREAEDAARQKQRVQEALGTAESAFGLALDALRFASEKIGEKGKAVKLELTPESEPSSAKLVIEQGEELPPLALDLQIDRETAVLKSTLADTKPREFDFAKDRHIAASDVEEYIGRRVIELVRAAQKASAW